MESALWAGKRKVKEPALITLKVGFAPASSSAENDDSDGVAYSYLVSTGLGTETAAAFSLEPQIKEEV